MFTTPTTPERRKSVVLRAERSRLNTRLELLRDLYREARAMANTAAMSQLEAQGTSVQRNIDHINQELSRRRDWVRAQNRVLDPNRRSLLPEPEREFVPEAGVQLSWDDLPATVGSWS